MWSEAVLARIRALVCACRDEYLYPVRLACAPKASRTIRRRLARLCNRHGMVGEGALVHLAIWARKIASQPGLPEEFAAFNRARGAFADAYGAGSLDLAEFVARAFPAEREADDTGAWNRVLEAARIRKPSGAEGGARFRLYFAAYRIEAGLRASLEALGAALRVALRRHDRQAVAAGTDLLCQGLARWWMPGTEAGSHREEGRAYGIYQEADRAPVPFEPKHWKRVAGPLAAALGQHGDQVADHPAALVLAAEPWFMDAVGGDLLVASVICRFLVGGIIASANTVPDKRGDRLELLHYLAQDLQLPPKDLDMALANAKFTWCGGHHDGMPVRYRFDPRAGTIMPAADARFAGVLGDLIRSLPARYAETRTRAPRSGPAVDHAQTGPVPAVDLLWAAIQSGRPMEDLCGLPAPAPAPGVGGAAGRKRRRGRAAAASPGRR
jgi:hypothetical protein